MNKKPGARGPRDDASYRGARRNAEREARNKRGTDKKEARAKRKQVKS